MGLEGSGQGVEAMQGLEAVLRCGTFLEEGGKSSMFVLAESLQSGLQTVSQSHREGTAEA